MGRQCCCCVDLGGSVWQTRRLIEVFRRDGYDVVALDFSKEVLTRGDSDLLLQLVDEVVACAMDELQKRAATPLLVGISLGALMSLNVLRRVEEYRWAVMITGGDIVKVAHRAVGRNVWPQGYDTLAERWEDVNMYSDPDLLRGKRILFVLPINDRLVDTDDVLSEVDRQKRAGNMIECIIRDRFGHIGTIIEETVLFPKRARQYVALLERMTVNEVDQKLK